MLPPGEYHFPAQTVRVQVVQVQPHIEQLVEAINPGMIKIVRATYRGIITESHERATRARKSYIYTIPAVAR